MVRRLLLVEDNDLIRMSVSRLMETSCEVTVACNGREALDVLERDATFDLVLSDVQMPLMDGLELVRAMRERRPHAQLKVVLWTGDPSDEVVSFAEQHGIPLLFKRHLHSVKDTLDALWPTP